MFPASYRPRFQAGLVLAALCLALSFLLAFRPLAERTRALDRPLTNVWTRFVAENPSFGSIAEVDLEKMEDALNTARASLQFVEAAAALLAERHQIDPLTRARMESPFQLVDFQNERQEKLDALERRAKESGVALAPAILTNFPIYTPDNRQPTTLWGQLWFAQNLLDTAVRCRVPSILNLSLGQIHAHTLTNQPRAHLLEIPIRLEASGPMSVLSRFLLALPMKAEEIKAAGLPEAGPSKPPLLISKFMVRKQNPQQTDEVKADLEVTGFVYLP